MLLIGAIGLQSCKKDDPVTPQPTPAATTKAITLNFTGLEDLGPNYVYEGWIMVNGTPKSAGIFTVNASGAPSATTFQLPITDVDAATAYILTIEPANDPNPAPSDVHVLAGNFSGTSASLSVNHPAALGTDFTTATGGYMLATPTDGGSMTNESSGVWFIDPAGPSASLNLPVLPAGWKYEGWAVINGTPVSTGTFLSTSGADDSGIYSGMTMAPPFPGEDFLTNAPAGLTFPTDLIGQTIVISIEPSPDNSTNPFTLKPLVGMVAAGSSVQTLLNMTNNAANTNPTGAVTR